MPNTYSQIHLHVVFAVKYREAVISPEWRDRLYDYITAIVQNKGHKMLAIGGTDNHIHMLFGLRPEESLSSLVLAIKRDSSKWINQSKLVKGRFQWQEGYSAFTYSKSHLPQVIGYIKNQEQHHARKTFREEYVGMLKKAELEYDERYLLEDE